VPAAIPEIKSRSTMFPDVVTNVPPKNLNILVQVSGIYCKKGILSNNEFKIIVKKYMSTDTATEPTLEVNIVEMAIEIKAKNDISINIVKNIRIYTSIGFTTNEDSALNVTKTGKDANP
jgi:hypothetical protein